MILIDRGKKKYLVSNLTKKRLIFSPSIFEAKKEKRAGKDNEF